MQPSSASTPDSTTESGMVSDNGNGSSTGGGGEPASPEIDDITRGREGDGASSSGPGGGDGGGGAAGGGGVGNGVDSTTITVRVKQVSGPTISLTVDPRTSVRELKQAVADKNGVSSDALKFIFRGAILRDDSRTLEEIGIHDGDALLWWDFP